MSEMLTAEEKLKANFYNGSFIEIHSGDFEDIKNIMIDFAKLHVEAALKAAQKRHRETQTYELKHRDIVNSAILNAYSLDNIK